MDNVPKEKLKLLHIAKMLNDETDAQRGLTMPEIIARLASLGIEAERKSVYRDLDALREIGMDIRKYHRAPVQYGLADRAFSIEELSLMVDAVQSSRFLTSAKARSLVRKVKGLASVGEREVLDKEMHVEGRVRTQQESALPNVSVIQQAMREKRKVVFRYCEYDANCKLVARRGGEPYSVTPVRLVYSEGNYYLMGFSDDHEAMRTYRVDRMQRVLVSNDEAARNATIATFDAEQFANRSFSMFTGRVVVARLRVDLGIMNAVVDRFGTDVKCAASDDGSVVLTVRVMDSATFYGWVAQFGAAMRIEGPQSLVDGFCAHMDGIAALYR